jgi:ATP-dependent Clp protease adaptor protein ClpS
MHNDDYTTMDFVVAVLVVIFGKPFDEAERIMLNVHRKGVGICGVYTEEVAETKVAQVHERAQESGFPLRCSMEPAE